MKVQVYKTHIFHGHLSPILPLPLNIVSPYLATSPLVAAAVTSYHSIVNVISFIILNTGQRDTNTISKRIILKQIPDMYLLKGCKFTPNHKTRTSCWH